MKKLIVGLLVLCLVSPVFGQTKDWKMTKDFEAIYIQSSLSVWNATVKALTQMKYQIKVADRNNGVISAQKNETTQWDILVQRESDGMHVLCQQPLVLDKALQNQFRKLATKIAENLMKKEN